VSLAFDSGDKSRFPDEDYSGDATTKLKHLGSTFTVKAKNSRFVANLALISAPKGNRIPWIFIPYRETMVYGYETYVARRQTNASLARTAHAEIAKMPRGVAAYRRARAWGSAKRMRPACGSDHPTHTNGRVIHPST